MPSNNFLKSLPVILFGALVGYQTMRYVTTPANQTVSSYSMSSHRMAKLGLAQNANSLFDVQVITDQLAATESGISTVQVKVRAYGAINDGLQYQWNLPSEVELIEGQYSNVLGRFNANEEKIFELKLRYFSKQLRRYISFEISGLANNLPVRKDVLISSRIEDSMEYIIQQSRLEQKAHGKVEAQSIMDKFAPEHVVR